MRIILFSILFSILILPSLALAYQNNFSYVCEGSYSTEINSGTSINNTILCPYGCNANNPIASHVDSVNGTIQGNICNPQPIFVDSEIIGLLFGFILLVLIVYMVIQRI